MAPAAASFFQQLPLSALHHVLLHLPPKDLGRLCCVSRLCRQAVEPRVPALYHYSSVGDAGNVLRLTRVPALRGNLDAVHSAPWRCGITGTFLFRETALTIAASQGHVDVLSILIAAGASLDAADEKMATPLMRACESGRDLIVERLLLAGADTGRVNRRGYNVLHVMATQYNDRLGIVERLLRAGAPVDSEEPHGYTALMLTAAHGRQALVEKLLGAGAAVNHVNKQGSSILAVALANGQDAVAATLLAAGAAVQVVDNSGRSPLMIAAARCSPATVGAILGALQAQREALAARDAKGWTAFMHAAARGRIEVMATLLRAAGTLELVEGRQALSLAAEDHHFDAMDWLLSLGIIASSVDTESYPALIPAVAQDNPLAVGILLANGCAVSAATSRTRPLGLAARCGYVGCALMLLKACPEALEEPDLDGRTPLMMACENGHAEIVETLLLNGADVLRRDTFGLSVLGHALRGNCHLDLLKCLLQAGALKAASADDLRSTLAEAAQEGCLDTARFLLENGVPASHPGKYRNPLHEAASCGRLAIVNLLLEHGASPTETDDDGVTALEAAQSSGNQEVEARLLEAIG